MDAAELERALVRLAEMASQARERMDKLAREIHEIRAGFDDISVATGGGGSEPESNSAKGTPESKPVDEVAQVEVVFK